MKSQRAQAGVTLVMSLIMLIVLTLLVVSAIRFSNVNLRLAGNAQAQAESAAAAQLAIDTVIKAALAGDSLSAMRETTTPVSTGGASYRVTVAKPKCNMTQNVPTSELDPTNPNDRACFGLGAGDPLVTSTNTLTTTPSACKNQMWDIGARVGDPASGSSVNILQGVSLRVGAEVSCPTT